MSSSASSAEEKKQQPVLTRESMNKNMVAAKYAVRGELVLRANDYQERLKKDGDKAGLPFSNLIFCNIGNPQALKQKPLTFLRQVLALTTCPDLLDSEAARKLFPADAVARARAYLREIPSGTGAYSDSRGVSVVRREVAEFIAKRDGHPCSEENVFLTDGASPALKMVLTALIRDEKDAVLTPIPQYPLYSATIAMLGGQLAGYNLDEGEGWAMKLDVVREALKKARAEGHRPRGIVVINPGNPTGQCMSVENQREVVKFCSDEGLVLLADEVYQTNVYGKTPFTSFKKVVCEMGEPYASKVELFSFHSASKGFVGECGRRGGYMELHNIGDDVRAEFYKTASISLCPNLDGQVTMGLIVNPPREGDESHPLYVKERDAQLASLARRAEKLVAGLNKMDGITCNPVEGAMYAFPRLRLPAKAVEAAKKAGKQPDTFYCLRLLDSTGICVVPGSGFGQEDGTFHLRTTILPPEDAIDEVVKRMTEFHDAFMREFK